MQILIYNPTFLFAGKAGVDADEEWFNSAFEDVPSIHLMSVREFDSVAKKIQDDLKTGTEYWEKKLEAVSQTSFMSISVVLFLE